MSRRVAVYAGTRAVYRNMAIAAKSLLCHTRMDRVVFLIEDDEFPEELPDVIDVINVRDQEFFPPDGANSNSQWTYMSLMRLALPEILFDEDVALWLDTDTIVEKDIGELFDYSLVGYYCAMVEEPCRSKYPFVYHNAGVVLMNLTRLWEDDVHFKMIKRVNEVKYTAPDQDMLNIFCQGEILTLGPEWNSAGHITQDAADPYIRHYGGSLKWVEPAAFKYYEQKTWEVIDNDPKDDSAED